MIFIEIQGVEANHGIGRIGFMPLQMIVEAKYGIILKTFFCLISPIFEKM